MDVTARFAELAGRPEAELALDEVTLLIAAHDHTVDVDARRAQLDDLAARAPDGDAAGLARYLFGELDFRGDTTDYGDPRNSYLDAVLDRRVGLPITLSVLMLEVGRRLGVGVHGVGMPGHFLVGAGGTCFDPFHGGVALDRAGCEARFAQMNPGGTFRSQFLDPVGPRAIVRRMLANLQGTFMARAPASAVWAIRLQLAIPDLDTADRFSLSDALGQLGAFSEAATAFDQLAEDLPPALAVRASASATRLRSRAN